LEARASAPGLHIPTAVVAPVSYFPFVRRRTSIDDFEEVRGLKIYHPRYLALPNFQFGRRWIPYYLSLNRFLKGTDCRANILFAEWVYPDAFAAAKYASRNGARLVVT